MFATIFFDLDDTLCDDRGASRRAVALTCAALQARHASLAGTPLEDAYLTASQRLWTQDPEKLAAPVRLMRAQAWRDALAAVGGDPALLEEAVACYSRFRRETYTRFPETLPLLRALRQHYQIGLITNGPADLQREKLSVMNLTGEFDVSILAGEVGMSKPDPAIFHLALSRAGCPPSRALMIGDSWEKDILAARAVGMTALWVHPGEPADADTIPHVRAVAQWMAARGADVPAVMAE